MISYFTINCKHSHAKFKLNLLTPVRWRKTFQWCNLCNLNFRRPNKIGSLALTFWNNHWLSIGDIVWFHTSHICRLQYILLVLWHILSDRFVHRSLKQTKQHFWFCWQQSFVWEVTALHCHCSIATAHTEQLKLKKIKCTRICRIQYFDIYGYILFSFWTSRLT